MRIGDTVSVVCTETARTVTATVHRMSKTHLWVVLDPAAGTLQLEQKRPGFYSGTRAGLEFTVGTR